MLSYNKVNIVVDTNVFISSLLSQGGICRDVIRACLKGEVVPLMGTNLFLEYEQVLNRTQLFARSTVSNEDRKELFYAFLSVSNWVNVYFLWRPNLPDETDNHVFELAIAGGAEVIVTENVKDFRRGELIFKEVKVLTPKEFKKSYLTPRRDK